MQSNTTTQSLVISLGIVIAGALVAGALIWNGSHGNAVRQTGTPPPAQAADITKVKTDGEPFIGDPNAPITIAFWSDYQCPFCKAFEVGGVPQITTPPVLPEIIQNYVDTGKVKVVFLDYPFLGNDSVTAAEYGRAIWKLYPSQYFSWRTAMYKAQDEEGDQGFGDAASIDKLDATLTGIDASKVSADVTANKAIYDAQADADKTEGANMGVSGTPSFVIGKQLIVGDVPYAQISSAIDAALKGK